MKFLRALLLIIVTQGAHARERIVCNDSGNMAGSYQLILKTGDFNLQDQFDPLTTDLSFKPFRSWPSKVDTLICAKGIPSFPGPRELLSCLSANAPVQYRVSILSDKGDVFANVKAANQAPVYVPCSVKDIK